MTRRNAIWAVITGGAFALVTMLLTATGQLLSLQIGLVAASIWFAGTVILSLVRNNQLATPTRRPLWRRDRDEAPDVPRPDSLRSTERVVIQAVGHPRRFAKQVRPRLVALSARRPAIAHSQHAWLIDESITDRTPTLPELDGILAAIDPFDGGRP